MLLLFRSLKDLDFSQLMDVYGESNEENARMFFPREEESQRIILAQQQFYLFLREVFFKTKEAFYAVWMSEGRYKAALRVEPFCDGVLLEALETAPEERRKGYAKELLCAVMRTLADCQTKKLYSHVSRSNTPSMRLHEACGFREVLDYAVYIDGSVSRNACTLCADLESYQ